MLLTSSDKVLVLYKINVLAKATISEYNQQRMPPRILEELDRFQDVINRKKWLNSAFIKLGETTKIAN